MARFLRRLACSPVRALSAGGGDPHPVFGELSLKKPLFGASQEVFRHGFGQGPDGMKRANGHGTQRHLLAPRPRGAGVVDAVLLGVICLPRHSPLFAVGADGADGNLIEELGQRPQMPTLGLPAIKHALCGVAGQRRRWASSLKCSCFQACNAARSRHRHRQAAAGPQSIVHPAQSSGKVVEEHQFQRQSTAS